MYSIIKSDCMTKSKRAMFALGSIVTLVGGATYIALAVYMMLNPYVG